MCYPFPDEFGPNYPKMIVLYRFLIYYVIPLIIISIFYVLMALHLIRSMKALGEMQVQVTYFCTITDAQRELNYILLSVRKARNFNFFSFFFCLLLYISLSLSFFLSFFLSLFVLKYIFSYRSRTISVQVLQARYSLGLVYTVQTIIIFLAR